MKKVLRKSSSGLLCPHRSEQRFANNNNTMKTIDTAATPSAIVRKLQSSPANEPAQVELAAVGTATIAASKNPYRSGFAVTVMSGGNRYGVGGFKATPSKAQLADAINSARAYIAKHSL
jgi:hypothetical protein